MINFLFLIALLVLAILVIFPFFYLTRENSAIRPGISHQILPPGYRRYTVSVPQDYSDEKPTPLILVLHFAGHGIPFYGEMILQSMIEPAFRELKPIIIAPDCPVKDWTQPESEQLIFDLLDKIQAQFNIDAGQILLTGYSLGGMGTWHFAGHYPHRFTAAIVMAGRPPADVLEIHWLIPLMIMHGREDELLAINETKNAVVQLENQGVDIEIRILEGVTHYDTNFYVAALRNAIPWLLEKWKDDSCE